MNHDPSLDLSLISAWSYPQPIHRDSFRLIFESHEGLPVRNEGLTWAWRYLWCRTCRSLSVVGCRLSVVGCRLSVVGCEILYWRRTNIHLKWRFEDEIEWHHQPLLMVYKYHEASVMKNWRGQISILNGPNGASKFKDEPIELRTSLTAVVVV